MARTTKAVKPLETIWEVSDELWAKIEPIYRSSTERQALLDAAGRALDVGLNGTPTYIVNGQVISYGPEASNIVNSIKSALGVK